MPNFCNHLVSGLVYNNEVSNFDVAPCCYFQKSQAIHTDTTIQDLQHLRQSWQQSDLETNCRICLEHERSGMHSYRQSSFDIMQGNTSGIEFLTVAVNKQCNLACATCGSHSSSFWYRENLRHGVTDSPSIAIMHAEDRQKITTEKFLRLLALTDLTNLKYVKFGGGEPLMSDTHERIMAMIDHPHRVTVQYTSNFSIRPSVRTLALWERMKLVKWVASLDGWGDRFFFLRWPYQWSDLERFWTQAKAAVPANVMFGVEHTVNPLNIFYFDEFRSWFDSEMKTNRQGDESDFTMHACHGVMSLHNTPPALRDLVRSKYGSDHPVVRLMDQCAWSGNMSGMIAYLDKISAQRNLSWRQIFPEVEGFFRA